MKCPDCGFVSFPGIPSCKKCGRAFGRTPRPQELPLSGVLEVSPAAEADEVSSSAGGGSGHSSEAALPLTRTGRALPNDAYGAARQEGGRTGFTRDEARVDRPWRDELAAQIAGFRSRRARLQKSDDLPASDHLEFDARDLVQEEKLIAGGRDPSESFAAPESAVTAGRGIEPAAPAAVAPPIRIARPASGSSGEWILNRTHEDSEEAGAFSPAPLAPRFAAGLIDGGILLAAYGIFAGAFLAAGGRVAREPALLAVAALIGAFLVLLYFGLFTVFAFRTPGQRLCGLTVRNAEGLPPWPHESLWRALGYLVSAAGLMLGFLWALMDADGMTWHDRMSNTHLSKRRDWGCRRTKDRPR